MNYCRVFHEASFLLELVATAPEDERRDEFEALADVHAESQPIHHALMASLSSGAANLEGPGATDARRLTSELHASFDAHQPA